MSRSSRNLERTVGRQARAAPTHGRVLPYSRNRRGLPRFRRAEHRTDRAILGDEAGGSDAALASPAALPQRHRARRPGRRIPVERRVLEPHPLIGNRRHKLGAYQQGAAEIPADGAGIGVNASAIQRRPAEWHGLIRPPVKKLDALRVNGGSVRAREARAGRHARTEREEALAPKLRVGGDDLGRGGHGVRRLMRGGRDRGIGGRAARAGEARKPG